MKLKGAYLFIIFIAGAMGFYYWLSTPEYSMGKIVDAIATENINELKQRIQVKDVSLLKVEKFFISSNRERESQSSLPKFKPREVDEVSYSELGCSKVLCRYYVTITYANRSEPVSMKMDLTKNGPKWLISKIEEVNPLEEYFSE